LFDPKQTSPALPLLSGPGHAFRISQVTPASKESTVGCAATGVDQKIVVYHQ